MTLVVAHEASVGSVIVMLPADGSGTPVELSRGMQPRMADATHLVFSQLHAGTSGDLWHMRLQKGQALPQAELLQRLVLHEWDAALSPDATLLAYSAGDPSNSQIMLRRYPEQSGQWQVSTNHGQMAVWNRQRTAIYYKDLQGLIYVVDVSRRPELTLSAPRLVERPSSLLARQGFDISPDGATPDGAGNTDGERLRADVGGRAELAGGIEEGLTGQIGSDRVAAGGGALAPRRDQMCRWGHRL